MNETGKDVTQTRSHNEHLHLRLHSKEGDRDAAGIVETLPRVLPVPGYLYAARAGVACHRRDVSLTTIARGGDLDKPARAATIFIDNGAPQALVGCLEGMSSQTSRHRSTYISAGRR